VIDTTFITGQGAKYVMAHRVPKKYHFVLSVKQLKDGTLLEWELECLRERI
jgi:hypothetical protein